MIARCMPHSVLRRCLWLAETAEHSLPLWLKQLFTRVSIRELHAHSHTHTQTGIYFLLLPPLFLSDSPQSSLCSHGKSGHDPEVHCDSQNSTLLINTHQSRIVSKLSKTEWRCLLIRLVQNVLICIIRSDLLSKEPLLAKHKRKKDLSEAAFIFIFS